MSWGKKANIKEVVIYTVLAIAVFTVVYLFVSRTGSQASFWEQVYAKEIALLIDKAEPGMEIFLDVSDWYEKARKNKFNGDIVNVNNDENEVVIKLAEGGGYKFNYFSKVNVVWEVEEKTGEENLKMKIVEKDSGGDDNE